MQNEMTRMSVGTNDKASVRKIILVGRDHKQILEKRYQAAGCNVVRAADSAAALNFARHQRFDAAVLLPQGSLLNVAETVFNLHDLHRSLEIVVLVDLRATKSNRFLRQLLDHPIEGTKIMTRRQLQQQLQGVSPAAVAAER
jgi:hypothetical protein